VEIDILDYTLTVVLSIVNEKNEAYPVIFYFYTFTIAVSKLKVVDLTFSDFFLIILLIFFSIFYF